MKAKCPFCESGCQKCDRGFLEVIKHPGTWWYAVCSNREECLFVNGGHANDGEFPEKNSGQCLLCGGVTEWMTEKNIPANSPYMSPENALKWQQRRHEIQVCQLLDDIDKIRSIALKYITPETALTVEDCRSLDICRICHQKASCPLTLNFGEEYAHTKCLKSAIPENP